MTAHPSLTRIFGPSKPIIAMIHVAALPGTPQHALPMRQIVDQACAEAKIYREAGIRALMIENMHDVPYLRGSVGPEIVAAMTLVAQAVRAEGNLPVGLQILAAADCEALAVAHAAELSFVRVECFSFAHVADEGLMQSNAAKLLRYRRQLGAEKVQIWADIKKKHASHALTADLTTADQAEATEFMGAEGLIITGQVTGRPPATNEITDSRKVTKAPLIVGSGLSSLNAATLLALADGAIVGSDFKADGRWHNGIDRRRVERLLQAAVSKPTAEARAA